MMPRRFKVLVVDDTEATRYAIARTLKAHSYDVIEAATGKGALEAALRHMPDLITLDIHLPDMIGFEVCRRLKNDSLTTHIPVLQVSASFVTSKDRIQGLEGGADSYLTHPFEPPVLIATVKALLRSSELNESLKRSEERFRIALKNSQIMIYTCDLNLRYTWVYNPLPPLCIDDLLGKTDDQIFSVEDAQKLAAVKREAIIQNTSTRVVLELTVKGVERHVDLTIEPLVTNCVITGLTIACIDITERVQADFEQRRLGEEAQVANQAKSRFLSNMSHEIRTPLGVIQGFADLALDPRISKLERDEYLATIKRNATNLSKLIGEILDLSKIEAGRIEIVKERFSLYDLVTDVVSAMNIQAKEKGFFIDLKLEVPFPKTVESDPIRVRQILLNLLSNAVKFTVSGGVDVKGRLVASDRENAQVEFLVTDSGIGLNEEQQSRLFQAFMQADSSTTRRFGGTGLGLNLSKNLASSLGGVLELSRSSPDVGSAFRFVFDAGMLTGDDFIRDFSPGQMASARPERQPMNRLQNMNVLLVEDALDNQILFSRYLQYAGAIVTVASDGAEALAVAAERSFDAILMDIQMPNVDGYAATEALRRRGVLTPIVALTAHALKEERDRALAHGFSAYLTKPLNPVALVDTLLQFRPSAP